MWPEWRTGRGQPGSGESWQAAVGDAGRLAAVRASNLEDGEHDETFDRISALAAHLVGAPASMVSLLDDRQEVVGGAFGLPEAWGRGRRLALSHSFAVQVVAQGTPLVISDTREDPVRLHSSAIDELGIIAYAGVPLATRDGHVLGSLAAIDRAPREWSGAEIDHLTALAELTIANIDLRREAHEAGVLCRTMIGERDTAERESARRQADVHRLEALLDVCRGLAAQTDARHGVCQAATELADASVALLWEANADHTELVLTAVHGAELRPRRLALRPGLCIEVDTFLHATGSFLDTVDPDFAVHHSLLVALDATSFALEPVLGIDGPVGVLEVAWQRSAEEVPASAVALVGLLSVDAAIAVARALRTT
ncbi:MAG TPA: GAF domain-containing protein [Solirubrobacteraceae bacterium]